MNPWAQDAFDHEDLVGGWLFYFFINILLFLVLVQLLIAIVCHSFEDARDDIVQQRVRSRLPLNLHFNRRQRPFLGALANLSRPFHRTCGLGSERLCHLLRYVDCCWPCSTLCLP